MIIIDAKYEIGQIVYLKTDKEQLERVVFGYFYDGTLLLYRLACGTDISQHYDFEMTAEKSIVV